MKKTYIAPTAEVLELACKATQSLLTTFSMSGLVEDYEGEEIDMDGI